MKKQVIFSLSFAFGILLGVGTFYLFSMKKAPHLTESSTQANSSKKEAVRNIALARETLKIEELQDINQSIVKVASEKGQGSGFRVYNEKYILTNYHVIELCGHDQWDKQSVIMEAVYDDTSMILDCGADHGIVNRILDDATTSPFLPSPDQVKQQLISHLREHREKDPDHFYEWSTENFTSSQKKYFNEMCENLLINLVDKVEKKTLPEGMCAAQFFHDESTRAQTKEMQAIELSGVTFGYHNTPHTVAYAKVVATDAKADLALLVIENQHVPGAFLQLGDLTEIDWSVKNIPFISFGFPDGKAAFAEGSVNYFQQNPIFKEGDWLSGFTYVQKRYYHMNLEWALGPGGSGGAVLHRFKDGQIKVAAIYNSSAGSPKKVTGGSIASNHAIEMIRIYEEVVQSAKAEQKLNPNYDPFPIDVPSYMEIEREFENNQNIQQRVRSSNTPSTTN